MAQEDVQSRNTSRETLDRDTGRPCVMSCAASPLEEGASTVRRRRSVSSGPTMLTSNV